MSIADTTRKITIATTNYNDVDVDDDNDNDVSTASHVQRHGLDELDAGRGKTTPCRIMDVVQRPKTESRRDRLELATTSGCQIPSGVRCISRFILVKAPADEGSSEPSFLNVAPGGHTRAQRNMDHGAKTLAPTPSNEPEAFAVS